MDRLRVAAIQMNSKPDRALNLQTAQKLIGEAARQGASIIGLPEMFNYLSHVEDTVKNAEGEQGETLAFLRSQAAQHRVYLVGGSLMEKAEGSTKAYNTSFVVSPRGEVVGKYRKIHLFNLDLPAVRYFESEFVTPGGEVLTVNADGVSIGVTVCYDLRFPELYRALTARGAQLIFVPSAFTLATGKDHWMPLLQARAIENQVYMVAPNQFGQSSAGLAFCGRSAVVDPWGVVLACAADVEGFALAEVDLERQRRIRSQLPCLRHIKIRSF